MMDRVLRVDLCGYLLLSCGSGLGMLGGEGEKVEEGEEELTQAWWFSLLKAQIILKRYV